MNQWILFVKKFAEENNLKYNEALKLARPYYNKPKQHGGGDLLNVYNRIQGIYDYTAKSKQYLEKYGNHQIIRIEIRRKPISVSKILEIIKSLNSKIRENFNNKPYDELFHLYMILTLNNNKKILVEKNQVINIDEYKKNENTEMIELPLMNKQITLNELLTNTKTKMKNKYFTYDAFKNNCQDFLKNIIISNNLSNNQVIEFVKQDVKNLLSKTSQYYLKLITDSAGFFNTLVD